MTPRRTPLTDDRLLVALDAAREAAELQRRHTQSASMNGRTSPDELVTETDVESERLILAQIRSVYPDDAILSEESGYDRGPGRYRWVVDPLDGTVNFYHGVPEFAVSIAVERDGRLEAGVVYDVPGDTAYTAVRGKGAYRERARLHVSEEQSLSRSLVSTGFPSATTTSFDALSAVVRDAHGVRRLGSAALDLASVASGRFEGFYQRELSAWDVAAGRLLVEEAGGTVSDGFDASSAAGEGVLLATNGPIHDELSARVRD